MPCLIQQPTTNNHNQHQPTTTNNNSNTNSNSSFTPKHSNKQSAARSIRLLGPKMCRQYVNLFRCFFCVVDTALFTTTFYDFLYVYIYICIYIYIERRERERERERGRSTTEYVGNYWQVRITYRLQYKYEYDIYIYTYASYEHISFLSLHCQCLTWKDHPNDSCHQVLPSTCCQGGLYRTFKVFGDHLEKTPDTKLQCAYSTSRPHYFLRRFQCAPWYVHDLLTNRHQPPGFLLIHRVAGAELSDAGP